ncbi:GNAT family N-acetyltransferase [Kitasatospora sp. NPDC001175]|uniref:GNAT family N-acetyltransferase n=1 Tax=Kitasatospora sp. NPDC001175 TaxID=3157103 RepID=UPI003CFD23EE
MTSQRLTDGWPGPDGGRLRLARPGDSEAVAALLKLADVELDARYGNAIEMGSISAVLRDALNGGSEALMRGVASSVSGTGFADGMMPLALALVAEDSTGRVVGTLVAHPPAPLISQILKQGGNPGEAMAVAIAIAKIGGLAVEEAARGAGWGSQLLKRTVQVYQQLGFKLLYGQFNTDSAHLESFYRAGGFTTLADNKGLSMAEHLGLPYGVQGMPGERLFFRWRR